MSRPIINIVDEKVVLKLTAQDNAASAAAASAAAAQVAKIEWQGNWVAGTYQISDAVAYLGSSWIANKETTEVPSLAADDWDLLAKKGDDGEAGAGVGTPLGGIVDLNNVILWDGFNRANGSIGVSDSGQAWETWNGGINIENKFAIGASVLNRMVLERTYFGLSSNANINRSRGSIYVKAGIAPRGGVIDTGLIIGRDSSNYLFFEISATAIKLVSVISGSLNIIESQIFSNFSTQMQYVNQINVLLHHDVSGNLSCWFWLDNRNDIIIRRDLSFLFESIFPIYTDVRYIGISLANNTSQCSNLIAYNLSN